MTLSQEEKQHKQTVDKISIEILTKATERATLKVPGVYGLCDSLADNISKMISGREGSTTGVKISKTKAGLCIQIYIVVRFGENIPQVAWEVQTSVKSAIIELSDYSEKDIKEININVLGVKNS